MNVHQQSLDSVVSLAETTKLMSANLWMSGLMKLQSAVNDTHYNGKQPFEPNKYAGYLSYSDAFITDMTTKQVACLMSQIEWVYQDTETHWEMAMAADGYKANTKSLLGTAKKSVGGSEPDAYIRQILKDFVGALPPVITHTVAHDNSLYLSFDDLSKGKDVAQTGTHCNYVSKIGTYLYNAVLQAHFLACKAVFDGVENCGGIRITASEDLAKNKPNEICVLLQGDYPKDFYFCGWHPNCRCLVTPIIGEFVKAPPEGFKQWCNDNEKRIYANGKVIDNPRMPSFISNNHKYVENAFSKDKPQQHISLNIPDTWKEGFKEEEINFATFTYDRLLEEYTGGEKELLEKLQSKIAEHQQYPKKHYIALALYEQEAVKVLQHKLGITPPQLKNTTDSGVVHGHNEDVHYYENKVTRTIMQDTGCDEKRASEYKDAVYGFSYQWDTEMRAEACGMPYKITHEDHTKDEIVKRCKDVEEYIARAPKWNAGTTYRGISLSPSEYTNLINDLQQGKDILKGMASWSSSVRKAKNFAEDYLGDKSEMFTEEKKIYPVILKSNIQPMGTSIMHLSNYPDEREVLVSKDCRYRLIKVSLIGEYIQLEVEPL